MSKKEIRFMGLLANNDTSILNVKLDHGFKIHAISEREGVTVVSILESLPFMEIYKKFTLFNCLYEEKLYYIDNSFESDIEMNDEGVITSSLSEVMKFNNNLVHGYLNPVIRLMRLFKEGNICMPLKYYYFIDNKIPKSFMREGTFLYVPSELYTLESSEIPDLQRFIQNTKLPFKESFLQLAFMNFEWSYQTNNENQSFLSLMISLETLFNPGGQELRYRVSRNTAVLLGKENEDSKVIFSEIKDLYDKRSNIVHTGKLNIINNEDLLKLRHYVRESIKEINKIGKSKNELLDLLNSCGFGERPWTK
jgi:hypothetical protein